MFELIAHAREVGVRVSLTPSATPLLTREIVFRLKEAGLARMAVNMDGARAETHDAIYGEHIRIEEEVVFPRAAKVLDRSAVPVMGEEFRKRRE